MSDHDWRLVPSAVGAWIAAWLGVGGYHAVAIWLGVLCAATAILVRRRWVRLMCVVVIGVAALSVTASALRHDGPISHYAETGTGVVAQVRVTAEPRIYTTDQRPPFVVAAVKLEWFDARGQAYRQAVPVALIASGDRAEQIRNLQPGASYLFRAIPAVEDTSSGNAAVLRPLEEPRLLRAPGPLHRVAAAARQGLRDATASLAPDRAALVPSLVVGDTSRVTSDMEDQFKATALTHLMAVSGANLTLMLGVMLALVRGVGGRGWLVRVVAACGVGMFILVCGPEPSVLRAAVMGLIALAATGLGKGRRTVRVLALCVIVLLLIDPWLSRSFGFALSMSACAGIVVLTPGWIEAMTRWSPRWLAEALSVPLAAQLATTPLIILLSNQISVVGVLSNLLAAPFVGPTTVLGFMAASLSWWPQCAALWGWAAGWAGQPILWIATWTAALPGSSVAWPPGWLGLTIAIVACVCMALLVKPVVARWWCAGLLVAVLGAASLLRMPVLGWPMDDWRVVFCAVGQGDATVLRASQNEAVLVDAGPEPGPVLGCLDALGVRQVPLVVLTHYHSDHISGFARIAERYRPQVVVVSALPSPVRAAAEVRAHAAAVGAEVRVAVPGERIQVGDVLWVTVAAGRDAPPSVPEAQEQAGESGAENDASVVGIASVRELRVILPGDVEPSGQRSALVYAESSGISLEAEILKLPHHGSSRQERDFFAATGARIAVASSGVDNAYGHPSAAVLRLSAELGMEVWRTDQDGSLAFAPGEGTIRVSASGRQFATAGR